jgi:hypothetical protein
VPQTLSAPPDDQTFGSTAAQVSGIARHDSEIQAAQPMQALPADFTPGRDPQWAPVVRVTVEQGSAQASQDGFFLDLP